MMLKSSILVDLYSDKHDNTERAPTFKSNGISEPLKAGEKGTSSIDYAFANQAGVDVVDDITLNWAMAIAEGLDHVPIDVTLSDHAFRRYIDVLVPILPIKIDELVVL